MLRLTVMSYSLARQGLGPEEIIDCCVRLGFSGIDWVSTYGREPQALRQSCASAGVPVIGYTFFLPGFQAGEADWEDELKRELDCACLLEAPLVLLGTPPLERATGRLDGQRLWAEAIPAYAEEASRRGLLPTVENYPGAESPLVTADDVAFFLGLHEGLRLTFDPGNAATGEDPMICLGRFRNQIVHVHLKNWFRGTHPVEGWRRMLDGGYYRPALVDEGDVDLKPVLRGLVAMGYDGCVNIEYEADDLAGEVAMMRARAFVSQVVAEDQT